MKEAPTPPPPWPSGNILAGRLEPYSEQGMEGNFHYNFMPDIKPEAVHGGRGYFLKSGDYLRIFQAANDVAWEGRLELVASRINTLFFRDRHRLKFGVWSTQKQKGVSYADWVGWFWANPRLRAEFLRTTE